MSDIHCGVVLCQDGRDSTTEKPWLSKPVARMTRVNSTYRVDTLNTSKYPGRREWSGRRFYLTPQDGIQFGIYDLFISGIFHSLFSNGRGHLETQIWENYNAERERDK